MAKSIKERLEKADKEHRTGILSTWLGKQPDAYSIDLSECDLRGVDFRIVDEAMRRRSNTYVIDLSGADLRGLELTGLLDGKNLSGADLRDTEFSLNDLTLASVDENTRITHEQHKALWDELSDRRARYDEAAVEKLEQLKVDGHAKSSSKPSTKSTKTSASTPSPKRKEPPSRAEVEYDTRRYLPGHYGSVYGDGNGPGI